MKKKRYEAEQIVRILQEAEKGGATIARFGDPAYLRSGRFPALPYPPGGQTTRYQGQPNEANGNRNSGDSLIADGSKNGGLTRYEEVVENSRATVKALCDWLGAEFSDDILNGPMQNSLESLRAVCTGGRNA